MYRRSVIVLLTLLVLTACGGSAAGTASTRQEGANSVAGGTGATSAGVSGAASGGASAPAAPEQSAAQDKAAAGGSAGNQNKQAGKQSAAQFGRKVILNANLTLLVDQADKTEQNVRALVQNVGGYVLQSQTSGDTDRRSVQLTVKVPAERFDAVLNALESPTFAKKVLNRSVKGEDVTEEYVDLQSRMRNLQATQARLQEFLKQAQNVDEALKVNQQLTDLQGQIEQTTGRMKFIEQSAALSTITVELQPDVVFAVKAAEGWRPGIAATAAWQNLLAFAQGLADMAIVLAIWSPVWGILLLLGLLVWRRFGRKPLPPASTAPPTSPA